MRGEKFGDTGFEFEEETDYIQGFVQIVWRLKDILQPEHHFHSKLFLYDSVGLLIRFISSCWGSETPSQNSQLAVDVDYRSTTPVVRYGLVYY